jgi:hypothetical protein
MAAVESGDDNAAAAGSVRVAGDMAALELGDDLCTASGTAPNMFPVTGYLAAVELGDDVFYATNVEVAQPPADPIAGGFVWPFSYPKAAHVSRYHPPAPRQRPRRKREAELLWINRI